MQIQKIAGNIPTRAAEVAAPIKAQFTPSVLPTTAKRSRVIIIRANGRVEHSGLMTKEHAENWVSRLTEMVKKWGSKDSVSIENI